MSTTPIPPDTAANLARHIADRPDHDPERTHRDLDQLLRDTPTSLGYHELTAIRQHGATLTRTACPHP